jgi:hypothetical protein
LWLGKLQTDIYWLVWFCCRVVDASRAGAGNLEIIVSVGSENIPNFVNADGGGRFRVTFTPIKPETHSISIKFNGDPVSGKKYYIRNNNVQFLPQMI